MSGKSPARKVPRKAARKVARKGARKGARKVAKKSALPELLRGRTLLASLTVNDIHTSLEWYTNVVGFMVDEKYEREGILQAVSMKAGAVRLVMSQDNGAKGMDRIKGEGFSLQITTAQNVDEIANRIKAAGWTLESEPKDGWGARAFRLKDPDGFKLVISSER